MKKKTLILSLLILMNCSSDDEGNNLMTAVVEFQDGFENANNLSDLIASDGSR